MSALKIYGENTLLYRDGDKKFLFLQNKAFCLTEHILFVIPYEDDTSTSMFCYMLENIGHQGALYYISDITVLTKRFTSEANTAAGMTVQAQLATDANVNRRTSGEIKAWSPKAQNIFSKFGITNPTQRNISAARIIAGINWAKGASNYTVKTDPKTNNKTCIFKLRDGTKITVTINPIRGHVILTVNINEQNNSTTVPPRFIALFDSTECNKIMSACGPDRLNTRVI